MWLELTVETLAVILHRILLGSRLHASQVIFLLFYLLTYVYHVYTNILCIINKKNTGIPTKKKGRGAAIGKDLEERRRKNGKPLEVTFCPRTYKVVGGEHAAFVRLVGTQIKTKVPGHYGSWELVPKQYKDQVLGIIQVKIVLNIFF